MSGVAIRYERVSFSYGGVSGRVGETSAADRDRERDGRPGDAALVLRDVTFDVREGECLGVLGPNGGGKSTLVKLTLGLLRGYSGTIEVLGGTPERARRERLLGYVPQRVEAELATPICARQAVELAGSQREPWWRGVSRECQEHALRMLTLVGASDLAERPVGRLSGGQLQRVMIARALAARPRLLLLDEPTVGIDAAGQQRFAQLLAELRRELALTIVIVSHDIRAIAAGCDRVACLSRTLHFHDAPRGLTPGVLAEVFRHDLSGVFGDVHVEAHRADQCGVPGHVHGGRAHGEHDHGHAHGAGGVVSLGVSAPRVGSASRGPREGGSA